VKRREFITLLGGAAAAWPLAVRAQQRAMPIIGFIGGSSSTGGTALVECFVSGLRDLGWIDGKSIKTEVRWTEGLADRYAAFANEFANSRLDLIVVTSTPGTRAVQRTTHNIPVVFMGVSDPVESGFVKSLSRPGGNLTGISNFLPTTSGKLIEFLKRTAPSAVRFCVLHNPTNPGKILEVRELQAAGRTLSVVVEPVEVRSADDFESAFAAVTGFNCDALIALQDGLTLGGRRKIADFATAHGLPTAFQIREFVEAGGLMSYGLNYCQHYRRAATYVDKILRGTAPAELPVELPTTFELVINLKTAKALGLTVPPALLTTADEVIE
jgi:putative tryptophan/tyrosine transport system substrate-binding protein